MRVEGHERVSGRPVMERTVWLLAQAKITLRRSQDIHHSCHLRDEKRVRPACTGPGSREPIRPQKKAGRLGHPASIPLASPYSTSRRGQSVPRACFAVAMLTLLRLPF